MPENLNALRRKARGFAIIAVFAAASFGQAPGESTLDRVFYLTHTETPQNLQEVANIIRSMTDIQQASVDQAKRGLALHGTPGQLVVAEWLLNEIDRPVSGQPATSLSQIPIMHDFRDARGHDEVVRVFNIANPGTPRNFQEITNLIREITGMQRVFPYSSRKVQVVRGSVEQVAVAEWLFKELDRPETVKPTVPQGQSPDIRELQITPKVAHVVRLFYFTYNQTPQDFQEIAKQISARTDVFTAVVPYQPQRVLAWRGPVERMALAERLVKELDKPSSY